MYAGCKVLNGEGFTALEASWLTTWSSHVGLTQAALTNMYCVTTENHQM